MDRELPLPLRQGFTRPRLRPEGIDPALVLRRPRAPIAEGPAPHTQEEGRDIPAHLSRLPQAQTIEAQEARATTTTALLVGGGVTVAAGLLMSGAISRWILAGGAGLLAYAALRDDPEKR